MEAGYRFLFDLAIILLFTKFFGLLTKKFRMPQVVGALIAGLVMGPACFGIIEKTEFIKQSAELGVIILMFCAGMETDIKEMKKCGKSSMIIALLGVVVPLVGGFGVSYFFNRGHIIASDATGTVFLQNLFMGIILTATSVSITVETLKELGKLKTRSGNAILGAAIIDDILGIIGLTIVTSLADSSVNVVWILTKIILYFVFSALVGIVFYKVYRRWSESSDRPMHRHTIVAFVFCLAMAYIAEAVFGVADITGAFIAGLIISTTQREEYLASKFDVLSYLYLSPIFFASIGLDVRLPKMTPAIIAFSVILTVVAILTKVLGCGLGAKLCKYKNYQVARIGVGMISRGEVALIIASKGTELGLLSSIIFGPVIIMVVITTIITPILLKIVFRFGPGIVNAEEKEVICNKYEKIDALRAGNPGACNIPQENSLQERK